MRRRKAVALLIETSNAYARGLLSGIMAYVRQHKPWSISLPELGRGDTPPRWLSRWRGDGIIARIETREIARAVARTRLPVVDVSAGRYIKTVPWVETDDEAIARAAVDHLLERLMGGDRVAPSAHLIPPIGVETRQSTDVLAIGDRDIAGAVRFIREHACDGATIADLLKAVPLSRRVLEARYRKATGRTPHEDLVRFRIDRVKQLLSETDHSLERIAALAGFDHPEYMSVAFKRETGQTPGAFRAGARGKR